MSMVPIEPSLLNHIFSMVPIEPSEIKSPVMTTMAAAASTASPAAPVGSPQQSLTLDPYIPQKPNKCWIGLPMARHVSEAYRAYAKQMLLEQGSFDRIDWPMKDVNDNEDYYITLYYGLKNEAELKRAVEIVKEAKLLIFDVRLAKQTVRTGEPDQAEDLMPSITSMPMSYLPQVKFIPIQKGKTLLTYIPVIPSQRLLELRERLVKEFEPAGGPASRPFEPHVTICYGVGYKENESDSL